ncbi:hypothetical protein FYE33_21920 [Salmonella enterica]|nr:hypothetical protein [Salmonella enterica]
MLQNRELYWQNYECQTVNPVCGQPPMENQSLANIAIRITTNPITTTTLEAMISVPRNMATKMTGMTRGAVYSLWVTAHGKSSSKTAQRA